MGNKPDRELFQPGFTERLTRHPRIAYYIYPDYLCGTRSDSSTLVSFVVDQLLVVRQLVEDAEFSSALSQVAEQTGVRVFDSEKHGVTPVNNVEIWKLKDAEAQGDKPHADVAHTVWRLRRQLPEEMKAMVAPNHVLVPPGRMHECPWGPPEGHGAITLPPRVSPLVEVVVIDSGFIMAGPVGRVVTNLTFAEALHAVPGAAPVFDWQPGTEAPAGVVNPLDQNGDSRLDALAGHANFVAGVVAQGSEHAELTVESFNCSVIDGDTSIPGFVTEAEVARSWWEHRNAPVVNVGFAFATLPDQLLQVDSDPSVVNGPPSWALQMVMKAIADDPEHLVVAPAGNQNCTVPQYPAAFSLDYENVVGVGSVDASGARSEFSNHGPWVSCCAKGENVVSSFVDHWNGETEEGEPDAGGAVTGAALPHPVKHFFGWASWSGTSFAAPKVSAAVADSVASSIAAGAEITPLDAWGQLKAGGTFEADLDMGVRLDDLPN
jgi:thermitase